MSTGFRGEREGNSFPCEHVILHNLAASLAIFIYYMLSSIQQSCPRDDSVSLLGGPLDLVRQNNFPVPHSHTSEEDSEWKGSPASVFLREMVGWGSLRKILLPGLGKIRFPRRKPMFNLAQRQLRLSLWGTELANRSTCRESKPAKEALSDTMLGIWTQAFLNCHFCHFVRRAAAQVYILCFLCCSQTTEGTIPAGMPRCVWVPQWCVAIRQESKAQQV